MILMKIFSYLIIIVLVIPNILGELKSSELIESTDSIEDVNFRIVKMLNHITNYSIHAEEKTGGFNYRYKNDLSSPFGFEVLIGKFNKKYDSTVIRIEASRTGEAKVIAEILKSEIMKTELAKADKDFYWPKYHVVSQTSNLISPALSIFYNSYNSPMFFQSESNLKIALYIFYDIMVVGIATVYANSVIKGNNYIDNIRMKEKPSRSLLGSKSAAAPIAIIGLAIPRIYHSFDSYYDTASHNRIIELGYTFNF